MKHFAILVFCALQAISQPASEAMSLARRAYESARAGNIEGAVTDLLQAVRLAPANPLFRSALGGIYERQGKLPEAIAAFAEAVRLDPANPALTKRLESLSLDYGALLARERRYRAGLTLARQTATRFPQSVPAHLMLGLFETRNQQNLAAVAAYSRALALDPQSTDASAGLGIAQTSAGLLREAEATFEAGLRKFPQDAIHRQAYGVLLVKIAESGAATTDRAIAMFESALKLDATLAEPRYQLGNLALAHGDAATAASHFTTAAACGLDDSRLHYAAARAFRRLGKTEEAARHLELFQLRKQAEEQTNAQP